MPSDAEREQVPQPRSADRADGRATDRVRVGILGAGSIFHGWGGRSGHLHAYRHTREARVVAVCDTDEHRLNCAVAALRAAFEAEALVQEQAGDPGRARELREDAANLTGFRDAESLFCLPDLDMVDIIASPQSHAPLSVRALEAGLHVFCQKPMTRTWIECIPVLDAVSTSGRIFGCAENLIFESPWYDAAKQIQAGRVGEVLHISVAMGVNEALPVRWHPEFSGGGALTDMGVHAIVAAWFLAGFHLRPVRAQAIRPVGVALRMPRRLVNGRFERMTVEDDAHVVLDLESPATGARVAVHVEAAWCGLDRPGTRIIGSTGDLYVEDPLRLVDSWGNAHEIPVQQPLTGYGIAERRDPEYSGFVGMVREMCRCVQDGQTPVYDARRAAEAMAVIGACYLSEMRDGAGVTIDEFRDYSMALRRREGDAAADVFIRQVSEHICTAASCRL